MGYYNLHKAVPWEANQLPRPLTTKYPVAKS